MAQCLELKIKVKHLAAEARIIRSEERKVTGWDRWHLQHHRKTVVRRAARDAQLAYGFARGRTYEQMEPHSDPHRQPHWREIRKMLEKYAPEAVARFDCWRDSMRRAA